MEMNEHIIQSIGNAKSRAIATVGSDGVNVVPVSMAWVKDNEIWLFNFFMGKTIENIKQNPKVALSCWNGLEGIQVKGEVVYETEGDRFDSAVDWVATQNPDRVTKGLLIITPTDFFNISAGPSAGERM